MSSLHALTSLYTYYTEVGVRIECGFWMWVLGVGWVWVLGVGIRCGCWVISVGYGNWVWELGMGDGYGSWELGVGCGYHRRVHMCV